MYECNLKDPLLSLTRELGQVQEDPSIGGKSPQRLLEERGASEREQRGDLQ